MPKRRKNVAIDPIAELEHIRAIRRLSDQRRRYTSKLDKHRAEILALRGAGATAADIRVWLHGLRVDAAESTIRRWLHVQEQRAARRATDAAAVPAHHLQCEEGAGDGKRKS